MARIQDIDLPYLEFAEGAAPAAGAAGITRTYVKADGLAYSKDDAGVETLMSGGAGGGTFRGVKAKIGSTTALTTATTEYPVAFSAADEYDTHALHDPATNNTRITIPAALTGLYFVAEAYIYVPITAGNNYLDLKFRKNGAAGTVLSQARQGVADGNPILHIIMAPTTLVTADYVELYAMSNVATRTVDGTLGYFALWVAGS